MNAGETVAVLGAGGTMGLPMARNLARAGLEVRAWNRSEEKARPLTRDGAQVRPTPAETVDGASVIVTMLSDAGAVFDTMQGGDGALAAAAPNALWAQMSTIGIDGTDRCQQLARLDGIEFVDAPVVGTRQPAEAGSLIVLASGPDSARERLHPVFDAIGQRTLWLGPAGAGTRLKLVTNSWILTVVEGTAETIALAQALRVDPAQFLDAVAGGPLDLPYLQMKGRAMLQRDFEPSFRLALAAKDAGLTREAAQASGVDLPLLEVIQQRLEEGVPGHGDEDMAATYCTSAPESSRR